MKKIEKDLRDTFNVIQSKNKNKVILSLNYPRVRKIDFITVQIGYISKRVWIASFLFIIIAIYGITSIMYDVKIIWLISAFLPFVSLMSVLEIMKSKAYKMEELENSTKYSLAQIIITRLCILVTFNLFVLLCIAFVLYSIFNIGFIRLIIYFMVPYLLTCSISLFTINHFKIRDISYTCGIISSVICIINLMFYNNLEIYASGHFIFWMMICIGAGIIFIKEITRMEEFKNATYCR